jgi:S-adenosylmethionine/arginine decarboxylase-like enzyme
MTTSPSIVAETPAIAEPVWGYHLLLDLACCRLEAVRSAEELRAFVVELVDAIDMVAYGEPLLAHFAEHVPDAAGWSLVQLIETSSITGHFCDASGDAYLDVFSCKGFEPEAALAVVERRLQPRRVSARFLPRAA